MKIWIRHKWYTISNDILIIQLTKKDRENIKNMHPDCDLYCEYDDKICSTRKIIKLLAKLKEGKK